MPGTQTRTRDLTSIPSPSTEFHTSAHVTVSMSSQILSQETTALQEAEGRHQRANTDRKTRSEDKVHSKLPGEHFQNSNVFRPFRQDQQSPGALSTYLNLTGRRRSMSTLRLITSRRRAMSLTARIPAQRILVTQLPPSLATIHNQSAKSLQQQW